MKYQELYKILEENIEKKRNILATVIQGPGQGTKLFFSEGELLAKSSEESFEPEELQRLSETEESGIREVGSRSFFVELLRKPSRLVICGGGHVAQQVILLAKRIGFHVTVLEDRPLFADQARKAGADLVICDDFASGLEKIPGSTDTYFLVVTRGHRYDDICLTSILRKERAYAGMMASRKRGILLKKRLIEEGIPEQEVELLHTPVGLSIHAETPEEIAVSIIAELIMEKNGVKKTSGYEKELLECLTEETDQKKALATIVSRRGSAPREIGTKMIVLPDGKIVGTIGGGCMESRVQHHCLHMLKEDAPGGRLVYEDMTGKEAEEEGLVCGGTIQVYLEVLGNKKDFR